MKKFQIMFILALIALVTFDSCKRGEDDPFISFRSRDKRIAGEWLISNISGSSTNSVKYHSGIFAGNSTTTVTTSSFTGFIWMQTITTTSVTDEGTETTTTTAPEYFNELVTIDKDGYVTIKRTYESGNQTTAYGQWYWINNNKKKIGITFDIDGDYSTFNILQLKDTELIIQEQEQSSYSTDNSTNSFNSEINFTYEKQD